MKYICPACTWTGETEKAFPCPACGIGDEDFPLIERKVFVTSREIEPEPEPLLMCLDCAVQHSLGAWLDNGERCPKCDGPNGVTEKALP
jgi:hypothetical protein